MFQIIGWKYDILIYNIKSDILNSKFILRQPSGDGKVYIHNPAALKIACLKS
jgi:hypothetical protein